MPCGMFVQNHSSPLNPIEVYTVLFFVPVDASN